MLSTLAPDQKRDRRVSPETPSGTEAPTGPGRAVKLCFISPLSYGLYRPESGHVFGGAEVQFFLLAQALAADPSFRVSVLTTVGEEAGRERHGQLMVIKRQGQGRLSGSPVTGWVRRLRACMTYGAAFLDMRRALRDIDADLYLHAGAGAEVGAYALICRLLRRRFVFVVASSADLREPGGNLEGSLGRLYPLGLRLADAIVCRTQEQQAWLRARFGREGVLIRTGHPIEAASSIEQSTGLSGRILWVGRGHPLKQPALFLDLAARLPHERFEMVIMRDEAHADLMDAVRQRASALANLALHEDVPWADVGRFFRGAKLLVNSSTYEGFPNTFVQAALQGIPILSWTVDPDEVLQRHGIGVCADGSFDRLVQQAGQLCADESRRTTLGRQALEYGRRYHDLAQSAAAFKDLVQGLT